MRGVRKVLVAVNGSMDVVRHGVTLAKDEKTWVTVLKVVPPYDGDLNLTGIKNISDVLSSYREKAFSEIKDLANSENAIVKTRIEEGEIDKKIIEVATEEKCDLIIMGAQKMNFFKKLLGMDIVAKVIGQAPCPVFVVEA